MKLKEEYIKILRANQRQSGKFKYTIPSSEVYPHQWFWDSCFHAIIYSKFGMIGEGEDEIRSLLQGQWKNGMIPHMIYWRKSKKCNEDWGCQENTSSITQPPMIAYAVERIYRKSGDKKFVKEVFNELDKYYKWLAENRADDYVLSIIHPWESGEDDFVSWDEILHIKEPSNEVLMLHKRNVLKKYLKSGADSRRFMKKNVFNVKCLLFNCVYLRNLKSMKFLAGEIGSERERYYQKMVGKVKTAIRKDLYCRDIGLFSSVHDGKHHVRNYKNSSIFLPLFAEVLTKREARKLVEDYLLDKNKFWINYPVPTVSVEDNNFQPNRYWRGSVWININWFIYQGLRNYGFDKEARKLKKKSLELVRKSGFHEYFNPVNGEGKGPNDFCWSGLVFDFC